MSSSTTRPDGIPRTQPRVGARNGARPAPAVLAPIGAAGTGRATRQVPLHLNERLSGFTVLLVVADMVSAVIAVMLTELPWFSAVALCVVLIICRTSARLYRRRLRLSYLEEFPRSLSSVIVVLGISVGIYMFVVKAGPDDRDALVAVAGFLAISELLRAGVFTISKIARIKLGRGDRTLVVGTDKIGVLLLENMVEHPEFGLRPVAFLDLVPGAGPGPLPAPLLTTDLDQAIREQRIGTVVISNPTASPRHTFEAVVSANKLGCTILVLPRMHELYQDGTDVERLRGFPLVRMPRNPTSRPTWWVKRGFDAVAALTALVLVFPVLAICAVAVLLESGRPILFRQERVSLDGRRFWIYKLRSLRPANEAESQTKWNIAGDDRVGPVGRLLRRTSLDELPQLWNIVRGDMSIVGPRPERPGFVAEFTELHEGYWARHRVPAGLTGLAQINGLRGDTSIADRARYDNYYIANWSLWLDLTIILRTTRELVRRGQH